jgi:Glutaminase
MKSFMLMAFLVFTYGTGAHARDRIHSIVRGGIGGPHLVKFNSGVVKFIEQDEHHKLEHYELKFKFDKLSSDNSLPNKSLQNVENDEFQVSLVPDEELPAIFKRMNPFISRKSECSDRAHVWAWDEFQRSGLKSEKAFLFLTDAYIRRTRYKWWFHVAPMFTTASGKKMVMDQQFLDRPVTLTEWKNHLVFSKRECVTEFRFLDYNSGADQTQDCYIKAEPMYYFIPGDIGAGESGRPKTNWSTSEINASRSRAFFKGSN